MDQADQLLQLAQSAQRTLTQHASWAEENGRLHDSAIQALVDAQVARLYLPTQLGGLAVAPTTCAQVCETLADADTAAAWHVMVFNAARLMAANWPQELVEYLWREAPDTLVAASGHTPLTGVREGAGVRVMGRNSFVSGCHHAQFMLAPMVLDGTPYMVVLPMAECTIVDNWDTLGMRGTGSNDVEVPGVVVTDDWMVSMAPDESRSLNCYYSDPLFRCPSRVVFATYVPVALSIAQRALNTLCELAESKQPYAATNKLKHRAVAQVHYGRALAKYRSVRGYFYDALDAVWQRTLAGDVPSDVDRAMLYLAGTHTMQTCAEVVNHVASAAGSSAADRALPLERLLRDIETLRHHGFANESRYGSVTQVLWGAELDYPLILR